jgi:hypothetical protein
MKKNSLTANQGLSLSQAQSISNLCGQRAMEIQNKLQGVNNLSKSVDVTVGATTKTQTILKGKPLPTDTTILLLEMASLHACQAFLMENMKAKEALLNKIKRETPDISFVMYPKRPDAEQTKYIQEVTEEFGWEQLSLAEIAEYTEAEAFAAHIGKFIHGNGILTALRNELPTIPAIEWMTIVDGVKSPVNINVHHTSDELLKLHENLAAEHRKYEQRVNYFKAKVKNLTTEENARIAKLNADAQNEAEKLHNEAQQQYMTLYREASEKIKSIQVEFEKERQAKIKEIASFRIGIDSRFQSTIDIFLTKITSVQE